MPKKSFQDVVPPQKRSIRDIPIPDGRKISPRSDVLPPKRDDSPRPEKAIVREEEWTPPPPPVRTPKRASNGGPRYALWGGVFVVLLVLAFAVSSLFEGATVKVTQRNAVAQVTGTFTATRDGQANTLPFDIIKVSRDDGKDVAVPPGTPAKATSTAPAAPPTNKKASGTIVIYNNQSVAQPLIATTRFEASTGQIFRIPKAVTVPAATTQNGQKTPGSIETTVVADQAGDSYNIPLSDFKIPGFKGDPKYDSVYGRSKTPMSGGGTGAAAASSAPADVVSQVKDEIQFGLKQQLLKDVQSQIPADYTTFDNGLIYTFDDLPQADDGANGVKISEHGTLYAIIFKKTLLGAAVAERFLPTFSGGDVVIANLSELNFTIASTTAFNPDTNTKFDFSLNGNAKLVWQYDEDALRKDLAGQGKGAVDGILAKYPSIQSADVMVRPVWNRSLPKDVQKIIIENEVSSGQ